MPQPVLTKLPDGRSIHIHRCLATSTFELVVLPATPEELPPKRHPLEKFHDDESFGVWTKYRKRIDEELERILGITVTPLMADDLWRDMHRVD